MICKSTELEPCLNQTFYKKFRVNLIIKKQAVFDKYKYKHTNTNIHHVHRILIYWVLKRL